MTEGSADASLGPTRRRVVRTLRGTSGALSAVEVAQRLGVHPNSARFHLDALVEAGLVGRSTEERTHPGRPRLLYAAVPGTGVEVDRYRDLAVVLTEALARRAGTPGDAAESAGLARGRRLAAELGASPTAGRTPARAAGLVVDGLARLGFASTSTATRAGRRIDITPCPYLDLARARPDVVCAVHRGLMRGVLEEADAPLEVEDLQPFAEADRCVAHLRRRARPRREPGTA